MTFKQILIYCLINTFAKLEAGKILAVFPTPSISHQIVFRPLTQELARRGHDVTVITTDPAFPKGQSPANLTEIDVHDISYKTWKNELKEITVGKANNMNAQLKMFLHLFLVILEQQFQTKEVNELIRNKNLHFDLILVEACVRPALIYSHIFKAPVIQVSSFGAMVGTNLIVGAPNHPLFQPAIVRQRIYNLSIWEKIREIYRHYNFEYKNYEHAHKENIMLRKNFGPNTPDVYELIKNVDMVFLNVHPIWSDNAPVPPGVVYMGGLHQQPAKELPKELLDYLESSQNGTIYLSFGTNVQSSVLPPKTVKMMMKVLSELPYNVIWKWDSDIPNKPSNIKIFKWLPQSDLLRHPKVKLFITQGGLQSTDEAILGGVPLIGIPIIGDQWYNVQKYVRFGIGQQLEMGAYTEEEFRNAIVTVIENQSYRHNIRRLRSFIHDQPQTPLERATWWIEHVLRHGGSRHLRSPAANMSWEEYYELKLVLILLTCLLTLIAALTWTVYHLYRYVIQNNFVVMKLKKSNKCVSGHAQCRVPK